MAILNPQVRASRGAKLAVTATAVAALATLAMLCWWAQFMYNRPQIDVSMLQGIAWCVLFSSALTIVGNVPLSKTNLSQGRLTGEAAKALFGVPVLVAVASLFLNSTVGSSIANAKAGLHGLPTTAAERANDLDLYAPKPMTAAERAEEKKHEIPWDGKGQDPNFLKAIGK